MDGDLLITTNWLKELYQCSEPSSGWGKLKWLDLNGKVDKIKTPSKGSAAGGITIIPRDLFLSLSGIPEDFFGSWGGEDNAFWCKLTSFGYPFKSFKSEVVHLYHSKTTPRILEIQKKALQMYYWNRQQWDDHVKLTSETFGAEVPHSNDFIPYILDQGPTKLTIAMLSWIRPEKLLNTLNSLSETLTIPINLTLMVQGSETLSAPQRRAIKLAASNFNNSDVFFTNKNIGTGPARKVLLTRAIRRFPSPYIMLADDDTTFTDNSIESAIDFLDKDLSIGVLGIRYKSKVYKLDSHLNPTTFHVSEVTSPIEYVDSTGSASAIIRRGVFDLCKIDPTYIIGEWDIDLFLQARSVGWKIVNCQLFPEMFAINDWGGSQEYRKARMNRVGINNSKKYFKQKWGLNRAL